MDQQLEPVKAEEKNEVATEEVKKEDVPPRIPLFMCDSRFYTIGAAISRDMHKKFMHTYSRTKDIEYRSFPLEFSAWLAWFTTQQLQAIGSMFKDKLVGSATPETMFLEVFGGLIKMQDKPSTEEVKQEEVKSSVGTTTEPVQSSQD